MADAGSHLHTSHSCIHHTWCEPCSRHPLLGNSSAAAGTKPQTCLLVCLPWLLQSVNRSDSANDDTKAAEQRVKDLLAGRRAPSAAAAAAAGAAAGNGALTRSNAPPSRPQRTPAYFNAKVQVGGVVWYDVYSGHGTGPGWCCTELTHHTQVHSIAVMNGP